MLCYEVMVVDAAYVVMVVATKLWGYVMMTTTLNMRLCYGVVMMTTTLLKVRVYGDCYY